VNNPFAEAVLSGQLLLALPIALLAGLVSFASPCVLPLVPGYLGYIGGFASVPDATGRSRGRGRLLFGVALFVLGFSLVFVAYGAAFGAVGAWLTTWQDLITRILGAVVIALGLVFIGQFTFMQRTVKPKWATTTGIAGAPLLGIVFGLGWTPCIGPTLAAVYTIALDGGSPWRGAVLGLAFCIGLGVPFLLVALGLNWVTGSMTWLRRHIRLINIIGGSVLVVLGVLMVSGVWRTLMSGFLAEVNRGFFPAL